MKQIILIVLILSIFSCSNQISFNSQKWGKAHYRKRMIEDVDNILGNENYTYDEIIELIGEPDLGRKKQIAYVIESGFGLKVRLLTITFEKELVTKHEIGYHD